MIEIFNECMGREGRAGLVGDFMPRRKKNSTLHRRDRRMVRGYIFLTFSFEREREKTQEKPIVIVFETGSWSSRW